MWVYKTIIIPKLTYASVAWATSLTEQQIQKLTAIQTLAGRLITRCKSSTPKVLLDALLNLTPIRIKLMETALIRALSLKAEGHWDYTPNAGIKYQTNQEKIDETLQKTIKIDPNSKSDRTRPTNNLTKHYTTNITERTNIEVANEYDNLLVYTDGSKDETGKTGFGIHFDKTTNGDSMTDISEPMNNHNSVFQAEVTAISKAAETLLSGPKINKPIYFYSDSQSAINAFDKEKINSCTVKQCINNLNELGKTNTVTINWIPGHQGYEGNEIADSLAKNGKERPIEQNRFSIPHSNLIAKVKNHYSNMIVTKWHGVPLSTEAKTLTHIL